MYCSKNCLYCSCTVHVLFGFLARVASLIKLHLLYFLFSKTHFHTFGCEYHTCQPYTNGAFCTPLGLFVLPGGSTLFWFLKYSEWPENTIHTRSVFCLIFRLVGQKIHLWLVTVHRLNSKSVTSRQKLNIYECLVMY